MKIANVRLDIVGPISDVQEIISHVSASGVDIVCFKKYVYESKNIGDQSYVKNPKVVLGTNTGKEDK